MRSALAVVERSCKTHDSLKKYAARKRLGEDYIKHKTTTKKTTYKWFTVLSL